MRTREHESHAPRGHMRLGTDACIPGSEHRRGTPVLACSDIPDGNQTTTTPSVEVRRPAPTWFRICVPPRDLARILEGAPLEDSLLGPSADVVVTLHEPTYVFEVATYQYDRRRLGARPAQHCLQPFSSVSVTLVYNHQGEKGKGKNGTKHKGNSHESFVKPLTRQGKQRERAEPCPSPLCPKARVFAIAVEFVICPSVQRPSVSAPLTSARSYHRLSDIV